MRKVILLTLLVGLIHALPQGTLKPKKYSRSQLRQSILELHTTIPKDSFRLQQEKLKSDEYFFDRSIKLVDQSTNNPVERASLDQLQQYVDLLKEYQNSVKQAQQILNKARKELEQSPLNGYTID